MTVFRKMFVESLRERSLSGTLEGLILGTISFTLLNLHFVLGIKFSLVNFTYGVQGLDPDARQLLLPVFVRILGASLFLTAVFCGGLLRWLCRRWKPFSALLLWLVLLNAVFGFQVFQWGADWSTLGLLRLVILENLFFLILAYFFLRTGSILSTAWFVAILGFVHFTVVNDVAGPFETFYFYSAASEDYYRLLLANFFLVLSLLAAMNRSWGPREPAAGVV